MRFAVEEGEIDRWPMDNMAPPALGEKPVPILTDDELRLLPSQNLTRAFGLWPGAMMGRSVVEYGSRCCGVSSVEERRCVEASSWCTDGCGLGGRREWC